ncbi:helix-turn-helix domain-containing protein [Oscillatoria sp. FACHB-1406]|nr:helix-turn-helix domain-containing protein [Oscillatoria sp. FACHB-1406]MBD2577774.1 helix-turn-helix domain-containing protein [Oscillatoria sp. FACHB-1406]
MAYTISESCSGCGTCQPQCPTGAIQIEESGQYWIELGRCNNCEGYYDEPQCIVSCPLSSLLPAQAKKGRYKITPRAATSPELFATSKNHPFASSMAVWEACNMLSSASILPWKTDETGRLYLERPVKQGRGGIILQLSGRSEANRSPAENSEATRAALANIDIRSASLHLIYAAYATTLERPWEQEFVINDQQIEKYLGLDKRKDLSKATKLSLIKTLAQQPCQVEIAVDWPQQGKVKGFQVENDSLWHLLEIQHHFQEDDLGCKYLIGLTFRLRAGLWAKYFLNQPGYKQHIAFYQYGTLPQFLLQAVMSIWQQHEGAARMMLWLLFKLKMGQEQRITVPTLMQLAYGAEKFSLATRDRKERKRLLRAFESDLEVIDRYGFQPLFDPVTYPLDIQPLWAKLADLPDDAEAALDFWIEDGSSDRRLTDSGQKGKWNLLMKARILGFKLPPDWERQLNKLTQKKQRRNHKRKKLKERSELSSEQILAARKRKGMSQRVLAQLTGKSQSWIRDLENGRFSPKPEDQLLLKNVLGLS